MTVREFDVLYRIYKLNEKFDMDDLTESLKKNKNEVRNVLEKLKKNGLLDNDNKITATGYRELDTYKVDNAIILAAGFGLRSLPLSRYVPKGLYKVRGEILIERQIEQLLEKGIKEIIVVVGYLKEQFMYLKEKYNVKIIDNNDYYKYNNISSIYAAKKYLRNSYICCSDNYFNQNVFEEYVYDSYYSCKYTDKYEDEYCVTEIKGDYIEHIEKGGSNAWYTIGEAYFSKKFSDIFLKYLEIEYENPEIRKMLWDDFHMQHIDELKFRLYKYDDNIVQEFDSVEDIIAFDPDFIKYKNEIINKENKRSKMMPDPLIKYEDIERYNSATTNEHKGRLHLNENAFGPSPKCLDVLKNITLQDLYEYDMATEDFLISAVSRTFSMPEDDIYIHNGSAEIIKSVFSIALERGDCILTSNPGWNYYGSIAKEKFCDVYYYDVRRDDYTYYFDVKDILYKAKKYRPKIIVITSPHNPTGCKIDGHAIETIIRENKDSLILLDEAYWGFSEEDIDVRRLAETYTNLIISRTFSKYYGLANERIGYAFCNSRVKHVYGLDLPLFRESTIMRKMALQALNDRNYYEEMNVKINKIKNWFTDSLNQIEGVRAFISYSNFVAVYIRDSDMKVIQQKLREAGILIRIFIDKEDCLARVTISEQNIMERVVKVISENI